MPLQGFDLFSQRSDLPGVPPLFRFVLLGRQRQRERELMKAYYPDSPHRLPPGAFTIIPALVGAGPFEAVGLVLEGMELDPDTAVLRGQLEPGGVCGRRAGNRRRLAQRRCGTHGRMRGRG
ncbi:MAG: hypothetical protein OXH08_07090 [Gammaproteobacteria bacterium]|nr:hypothetical protein [Gemmatimonadota bacterium]MCY3705255.1 hypothetical protein [Gammaproteobacteria bacterium]